MASYARLIRVVIDILELLIGGQIYSIDEEKARILIATFFPTPLALEESEETIDNRNYCNLSLA